MMRLSAGLAALAFVALAAGPAGTQEPARDKLLLGTWACSTTGIENVETANAQFEPGGVMVLTFSSGNISGVTLSFVISGLWTYDRAADAFSHTVRGARFKDLVVNGTPLARSQYPGGEAALAKLEDEFMAQYSASTFTFSKVSATELVLTDPVSLTSKVSCAR